MIHGRRLERRATVDASLLLRTARKGLSLPANHGLEVWWLAHLLSWSWRLPMSAWDAVVLGTGSPTDRKWSRGHGTLSHSAWADAIRHGLSVGKERPVLLVRWHAVHCSDHGLLGWLNSLADDRWRIRLLLSLFSSCLLGLMLRSIGEVYRYTEYAIQQRKKSCSPGCTTSPHPFQFRSLLR